MAMLDVAGRIRSSVAIEDYQAATELARAGATQRPKAGGVAVIPVIGSIEQRASMWTWLFGGSSVEQISADLKAALADPNVSGILLEFDSPGGTVAGVPELAKQIRSARGQKPILAHANAEAASAAYYLASQADEVSVTPSGQVGSIGVVYLHTDMTGMADQQGVKFQIFRSQDRKADVNPYEPLSAAAAEDIQAKVDAYDAMFVRDVARGRGVSVDRVRSDYGSGRMFMAADALAAGMVDRVETFDEALARLSGGKVVSRQAAQASEELEAPPEEPVPDEVIQARLERLAEIAFIKEPAGGMA